MNSSEDSSSPVWGTVIALWHLQGFSLSFLPSLNNPGCCSVGSNSLWPHGLQRSRLPCLSPSSGACSSSCPSSWWCHPTISSSVTPFSTCLQSSPESGSFSTSQFFTSGGQIIGVSASASVLSINTQDWFPLGWTGWISLQSKGLSRVFSNTTVQKHMDTTRWSIPKSDWIYSLQSKIEKLYTVSKDKTGSWLWFRSWTP